MNKYGECWTSYASRKCEPIGLSQTFEASRRLVLWNVSNSEAGMGWEEGLQVNQFRKYMDSTELKGSSLLEIIQESL